jgi:CheY-like chemotaxis protein
MGLDMASEHRPDLILLDLHLPDMTGNEVLRRLRENPGTATIPVVVLTADANPLHVEKLLEAGAQAYLTKPLDVMQLLNVLEETPAGKAGGVMKNKVKQQNRARKKNDHDAPTVGRATM